MKETIENLFSRFVAEVFDDNQSKAAAALHCNRSLVCRLCKGSRRVTPDMAAEIERLSSGRYARESFIWPDRKAA